MYVLGIDPGKKGGLVLLDQNGKVKLAESMPKDLTGIYDLFLTCNSIAACNLVVAIEKAQAMPKQGVCSMFTIGVGYGALLMACEVIGVKPVEINARTWKGEMIEDKELRRDKNESIRLAEYLLPDLQLIPKGKRVPQDGIAEAALIALYWLKKRNEYLG